MAWYQAMGSQTVRLLSVKTEAEGVLNDRWEGSGVLSVPPG